MGEAKVSQLCTVIERACLMLDGAKDEQCSHLCKTLHDALANCNHTSATVGVEPFEHAVPDDEQARSPLSPSQQLLATRSMSTSIQLDACCLAWTLTNDAQATVSRVQ